MAHHPGHMRWQPVEWLKVAVHALPHIGSGATLQAALAKAQRTALSKDRRHDSAWLTKTATWQTAEKYIAEARALPADKRAELAPPDQEPSAKVVDHGERTIIRWTTLEKARVARQVKQWRDDGDERVLSRLIIEAQDVVIEPDRRRPVQSLQQAASGGANSLNQKLYEEGLRHLWLLKDEAAPASTPAPSPAPAIEPAITPLPNPAPTALLGVKPAISEAARVFGETVMGALDKLLVSHTDALLREVYGKLNTVAHAASVEVAAMIERGMRETVHKLIEQELGGPVAPPDPEPAQSTPPSNSTSEPPPVAAKPETQEAEPPRKQLRVDVVGLVGNNVTEVRKAFNGNTDLRFFDPDQLNNWAPHKGRHVICAIKWIPHKAKDKLRAVGIQPINVTGSVGTVIHAIEELHRTYSVPT